MIFWNAQAQLPCIPSVSASPSGGVAAGHLELQHSDHADRLQVQALRGA